MAKGLENILDHCCWICKGYNFTEGYFISNCFFAGEEKKEVTAWRTSAICERILVEIFFEFDGVGPA